MTIQGLPKKGVELIKEYEGFKSKAYYDPLTGGLPITIGYGSTRRKDGSRFMIGNTITQDEADDLLYFQLRNKYLPSLEKIPYWNEMNENQQGSLLSFAYNLGADFYGSSGFNTITRVLKEKRWKDVPEALKLYRNPGTKVEKGLMRRRIAEGKLWIS
jgi:lysozyme